MVTEKIKNLALRREVQIIAVFGILTAVSYYVYMKNQSKARIAEKAKQQQAN